jgi:hypothetical protein
MSVNSPDELFRRDDVLEIFGDADPDARNAPYFIDIHNNSVTEARPGLLVRRDGAWKVLSFDGETFAQNGWCGVRAASDGRQISAVTDCRVESPGWELQFVLSQDCGRTFRHIGTLKKPCYMAGVSSFAMDERGNGEVSLELDEDYGPSTPPLFPAGIYSYKTRDFGAHWEGPRFSKMPAVPVHRSTPTIQISSAAELQKFLLTRSAK